MSLAAAQEAVSNQARAAQRQWAAVSVSDRLVVVRKIRDGLANDAANYVDLFPATLRRTRADSLTTEIIPLAEACRFLELEAKRTLAPRRLPTRGRPLWLGGVDIELRREPLGVVLIIGPSNYPLFLPGVQALQALVAGNAVIVKPGSGGRVVMEALARLANHAGLPADVLTVLDETVESARGAIRSGVDKVVITGSVESGKSVLRAAAESLTPVIAELSGDDPVFVLPGADVRRAIAAIRFGIELNGGQTCIAPRRVIASSEFAAPIREALGHVISVIEVATEEEALTLAARSPYALGASVFGEEKAGRRFARSICAGVVVVNDIIVPTADPRVPFGGRRDSGFGTTRGAEGLLAMTAPKAVLVQRAKRLRHLEAPPGNAEELFLAHLSANHSDGWRDRLRGWRRFGQVIAQVRKVSA